MFQKFTRKSVATLCLAATLATGATLSYRSFADDMMAKDDMMKSEMMKMKDGMKDDASKMAMTQDMAKMMVMHHMMMDMCKDGKCEMMMKNDPDMMKMMDDAKAMAMDQEKMKMMQQQIMADPQMMHQVMTGAMAQSMMMKDMDMKKGGDSMKK